VTADFHDAQAESVGKQHQHQAHSCHNSQDWEIQRHVRELQPDGPNNGAERKKNTDLRNIGAVDQPRE
jgi:hypothetical protein